MASLFDTWEIEDADPSEAQFASMIEQLPSVDLAASCAADAAGCAAEMVKRMRTIEADSVGQSPWTGPTLAVESAPWCVLLGPEAVGSEPFVGWTVKDRLALRSTSRALHGEMSTAFYLNDLLAQCGWRNPPVQRLGLTRQWRWETGAWLWGQGERSPWLSRLVEAILAELEFVRRLEVLGHAGACCVAGSHALHRLMLFDLGKVIYIPPDGLPMAS